MPGRIENELVIDKLHQWFTTDLGCQPGRREFARGRFKFYVIEGIDDFSEKYRRFLQELAEHTASGCVFVFPDIPTTSDVSVEDVFALLGSRLAEFTLRRGFLSSQGEQVNNKITALCPVTNQMADFFDFDFVAFCPQSMNEKDPLYNPSLEMPFACINLSSDVFGFSLLVRDVCSQIFGCLPFQLSDMEKLDHLFERSIELWQRLAMNTMKTYASRTNADLVCPIHVSKSQAHWISTHSDSSFASLKPDLHLQEMPKSYAPRIVEQWRRWFEHGEKMDFAAVNIPDMPYLPANKVATRSAG